MTSMAARFFSRLAASLALLPAAAVAQSPAEFYKGKTVDLYIAYSVGGGYDLYARLLARHLGKHIPGNPLVVPKNMEGAGGLRLANWLYAAAPRDGTAIGASWVTEKKINLLMQFSLAKHVDLPDVPLIMDLAKTDEQRQMFRLIFARQTMGRPFQGPPGVPADRLRALQQAFMDTMKDKDFLAEAAKAQFEITPVSGEAIEKLVADAHRTPPEVAQKAGRLV